MNQSATDFTQALLRRARLLDDSTRHIITVLAGQALRLGLGLASSAMLARGLGPEGLSAFSVVSAALLIALSLGDLGLSNSTVRYLAADLETNLPRARATAQVFARMKLLASAAVFAGSLFLAGPLATLLGLPVDDGAQFVRFAALGIVATASSGIIATVLRALGRFPELVAMQTLNVGLTVILLGVLFVLGKLTIVSALLVGAVTALAATLLGWVLQPQAWRETLRSSPPRFGPDARRLWQFGRWLWLSNLLSIALAQLDLLLLNRWASPEATGQYALALNLALKTAILNQTLHTVLLPGVSSLNNWEQFAAYARRSLARSAFLVAALVLVLPLARPFIHAVYGAEFAPAVPLFYLLLLVTAFELLVDPLLMLAYPLDMSRQIAVAHLLRLAVMLLLGSLTIPQGGASGAALSKLAAYLAGALLLGGLLLRRLRQERDKVDVTR